MINIFLILMLAHLLTDFVFQTEEMVREKTNLSQRALMVHSITFFVVGLIQFWVIKTKIVVFIGLFFLSVFHYIIDWIKSLLLYSKLKAICTEFRLFLVDQLLHLLSIICFVLIFSHDSFKNNFEKLINFLTGKSLLTLAFSPVQKLWIALILLILVTSFTNIFIRLSLSSIKLGIMANKEAEVVKIGRYIGTVERILTVLGVIGSDYTALAALYGGKAAIRFKQAGEEDFAQYFILGTSISAIFGIVIGLLAKYLLF